MNQFAALSDGIHINDVIDYNPVYINDVVEYNPVYIDGKPELTFEQMIYMPFKRLVGFTAALMGLIICLPIFLLTAIAIKLDSPGPVFFKQERVGKDGKSFFMYKFRSMVVNAEELKDSLQEQNESDGPFFKIKHDPRVTKVGRFIRKYSVDELPQLFNVFIGDMSLVGPRPALFNEIKFYSRSQLKNLCVSPGLTCYWQIGGRSDSANDRIDLDTKYIQEFNPLIDFEILLRTPFAVFMGKGAC